MWNWSVDEKSFKKKYPKEYRLWRLVQLINYGLDKGERLDEKEVKKAWSKIKEELDPNKVIVMEYLLWNKKPSSNQFIENFWSWSIGKNI